MTIKALYKTFALLGLGLFLFFAMHEAYNWRYGIIYQYGLWPLKVKQLSIVRPNNITFFVIPIF